MTEPAAFDLHAFWRSSATFRVRVAQPAPPPLPADLHRRLATGRAKRLIAAANLW
jgi:hypothetical protein